MINSEPEFSAVEMMMEVLYDIINASNAERVVQLFSLPWVDTYSSKQWHALCSRYHVIKHNLHFHYSHMCPKLSFSGWRYVQTSVDVKYSFNFLKIIFILTCQKFCKFLGILEKVFTIILQLVDNPKKLCNWWTSSGRF